MSKINYYGTCPICSCSTRGITEKDAECSNTDCPRMGIKHGKRIDLVEGRYCSVCNKQLWEGMNAAFCGNDECERYMREQ